MSPSRFRYIFRTQIFGHLDYKRLLQLAANHHNLHDILADIKTVSLMLYSGIYHLLVCPKSTAVSEEYIPSIFTFNLVLFQKTELFINTAVGTSSPENSQYYRN
jgi:hypothetical protein